MERQLCTLVPVWQQRFHNNFCHVVWMFWSTLSKSLHHSLVLLLLTLNIICLLWISLNATLWHIFVEHQKNVIFMGVIAATPMNITLFWYHINFELCQWLALWGVLFRYFTISCYDDVIFNFYYFIAVHIGKTCSRSLMRFNNRIFYILRILHITDFK